MAKSFKYRSVGRGSPGSFKRFGKKRKRKGYKKRKGSRGVGYTMSRGGVRL
ncbi:hypothetical protein ES705_27905 [subsurface metagenome]